MKRTIRFFKIMGFMAGCVLLFSASANAAIAVKAKQRSIKAPKGVQAPRVTLPKAAALNRGEGSGAGTSRMRVQKLLTPSPGLDLSGLNDTSRDKGSANEPRTGYFMQRYLKLQKTVVKSPPNSRSGSNGEVGEINGSGSGESVVAGTNRHAENIKVDPDLGVGIYNPHGTLPWDVALGLDPSLNPGNLGPNKDLVGGLILSQDGGPFGGWDCWSVTGTWFWSEGIVSEWKVTTDSCTGKEIDRKFNIYESNHFQGDGFEEMTSEPSDDCDCGESLAIDLSETSGATDPGPGAHQAGVEEERKGKEGNGGSGGSGEGSGSSEEGSNSGGGEDGAGEDESESDEEGQNPDSVWHPFENTLGIGLQSQNGSVSGALTRNMSDALGEYHVGVYILGAAVGGVPDASGMNTNMNYMGALIQ